MKDYLDFLKTKETQTISAGFDFPRDKINKNAFEFQKDIISWALKKGKCAILTGCGSGKTLMQCEWARIVSEHENGKILILAPLSVVNQTVRESKKFGIAEINVCRTQADVRPGLNITNYEILEHFDPNSFVGVVLDESSILKSFTGKIQQQMTDMFRKTPYKLLCTATIAPNDYTEIGTSCEFLGIMSRTEMLATYFIHDGTDTSKWRLKKAGRDKFWEWFATWAIYFDNPAQLGYKADGYDLPELNIETVITESEPEDYELFAVAAETLEERRKARKDSLEDRSDVAAKIVNSSDDVWLVWCDYNDESDTLKKKIVSNTEIKGSDDPEAKAKAAIDFADNKIHALISKPSIFGFGGNFQNCNNMIFCGLSDSYERFYQAVRRCWRFGQKNPVNVHVIISEREINILENIKRKESQMKEMQDQMISRMKDVTLSEIKHTTRITNNYFPDERMKKTSMDVKILDQYISENAALYNADTCEAIKMFDDNSIHFSVFSPPFSSLYTYSNSDRDLGNSKTDEEFFEHFKYIVSELYRIMIPGRIVAIHCMNLPTSKEHDGFIGIKDFRGDLIRLFQKFGFIYHAEVCIWKNPVTAMQRTKALGLLHKQIKKDSCMSRMGIPDYVVFMRKPGENPERVEHTNETFPVSDWQQYASPIWDEVNSPVWWDINQSNTLNARAAMDEESERHICPLQLDVIEKCLRLYTNEGDTVFTPFLGIGSEVYQAIKMGRKGIGIELKPAYFNTAVKNIMDIESEMNNPTIFDYLNK